MSNVTSIPGTTTKAPEQAKQEAKTEVSKPAEKPKGEKKARTPAQEYGYKPGAKIKVTGEGKSYKGKRAEYFERLKAADGKTVEEFAAACPKGDPPRGWLRFFATSGACTLSGGKDPEPKPAKKPKAEKPATPEKEGVAAKA